MAGAREAMSEGRFGAYIEDARRGWAEGEAEAG